MDTAPEEQLDFGDDDYGGAQKAQYQGSGAIPALADEDLVGEDDDYEDLYDGVNVGEGFQQFHRPDALGSFSNLGSGAVKAQTSNVPESRSDSQKPGVILDQRYQNAGPSYPEQKVEAGVVKAPDMGSVNNTAGMLASQAGNHDTPSGGMGFQGSISMSQRAVVDAPNMSKATISNIPGPSAPQEMGNNPMTARTNVNMNNTAVNDNIIRPQVENGPTMLFVGELHWWTTDAELESVLSQYGKVKEIKFFDERASGKSKGYCQVEFYDAGAAAACKEGMNGHVFNGRACVVAFASPQTLKQMGAAYASKNPPQPQSQPQGRRNGNDGAGRGGGTNYPPGDGGRNFGRGGWGRGGQGAGRGPGVGGPMGRGGAMGPRNSLGNAAAISGGPVGNFGQGLAGPAYGIPGGGMVHPQAMMGPGFDPTFMGRGAAYRGFSGPSFPGMMPTFPAVNPMGLPGVAPHINPAFFGRGMVPNGMGMMGSTGMEGHPGGMWADPGMGSWGVEEPGQKTRESSYGGDDGASDYGYGEGNAEKGARTNAAQREKERAPDRDRSGNSERRYRDEREQDWDRSDRDRRYREEKDSYKEPRRRERDLVYEDDWDRGQSSSRSRSRSRAVPEDDDHRSRSRDIDYGKRRRAPSE